MCDSVPVAPEGTGTANTCSVGRLCPGCPGRTCSRRPFLRPERPAGSHWCVPRPQAAAGGGAGRTPVTLMRESLAGRGSQGARSEHRPGKAIFLGLSYQRNAERVRLQTSRFPVVPRLPSGRRVPERCWRIWRGWCWLQPAVDGEEVAPSGSIRKGGMWALLAAGPPVCPRSRSNLGPAASSGALHFHLKRDSCLREHLVHTL